MKVETLMNRDVASCIAQTPLSEVARIMWDGDTGFVVVIDASTQKLVGVITDRDVLMASYTTGKPLWALTASVGMTKAVRICAPDDEVERAEQIMGQSQVRRLPVVEPSGKIVGVLSLNAIARKAAQDGDDLLEEEVGLTLGAICRLRTAYA